MPVSRKRRNKSRPKQPQIERNPDGSATIHLDDQMVDTIEQQLQAFRDKFGREPGPNDPIFFDPDMDTPQPISIEKQHAIMLAGLREMGAPPEIIYAFNKTDRVVLPNRRHMLTPDELAEWDAAVAEGREQHQQRKYGKRRSAYTEMLADRSSAETPTDPRSTEEIRENYLRGKREHPDDPLVVEICDAGLALLDAEIAFHDAPLGTRTKARIVLIAAQARMDAAMRAMGETMDTDQLDFLRGWNSNDKPQ